MGDALYSSNGGLSVSRSPSARWIELESGSPTGARLWQVRPVRVKVEDNQYPCSWKVGWRLV